MSFSILMKKNILFIFMLLISGFVFWDLFVRDNPPMLDIEGSNFVRMIKGIVEFFIGVSCSFILITCVEEG